MRKTLHKYLFMRRYALANRLGQRLERLICVAAYDKDDAVAQILEHFKHEAIDTSDLDYIEEVGLEHFVGILGTDISRKPDLAKISQAVKKTLH